jgi:hypothetical protein
MTAILRPCQNWNAQRVFRSWVLNDWFHFQKSSFLMISRFGGIEYLVLDFKWLQWYFGELARYNRHFNPRKSLLLLASPLAQFASFAWHDTLVVCSQNLLLMLPSHIEGYVWLIEKRSPLFIQLLALGDVVRLRKYLLAQWSWVTWITTMTFLAWFQWLLNHESTIAML